MKLSPYELRRRKAERNRKRREKEKAERAAVKFFTSGAVRSQADVARELGISRMAVKYLERSALMKLWKLRELLT